MEQNNNGAQWEYGVYEPDESLSLKTGLFTRYNSPDGYIPSSKTSLFDLGKQGWEAFAVTSGGVKVNAMIMKRRLQ